MNDGDVIFSFTDGFADQFGGPEGKKYKYRAMKNLFISIAPLHIKEQKKKIAEAFEEWKNFKDERKMYYEQVDDICVVGIKI